MKAYKMALYLNDGSDPEQDGTIYPSDEILILAQDTDGAITKAEEYWEDVMKSVIISGNAEPDSPGIGSEELAVSAILLA